jgi:hypothetical protein
MLYKHVASGVEGGGGETVDRACRGCEAPEDEAGDSDLQMGCKYLVCHSSIMKILLQNGGLAFLE